MQNLEETNTKLTKALKDVKKLWKNGKVVKVLVCKLNCHAAQKTVVIQY